MCRYFRLTSRCSGSSLPLSGRTPMRQSDSKPDNLLQGSNESTSRHRREASQLGIVDMDRTCSLDRGSTNARDLIRRKCLSTRHLRSERLSSPDKVGGSSNSSAAKCRSARKGAREVSRGATKDTLVREAKSASTSTSPCAA